MPHASRWRGSSPTLTSSLSAPGEGVAEGNTGRIRFVEGQGAAVTEQAHHRARHLFLARATCADHRLLYPEGRILENRFSAQRRRRDRRSARGSENLRRLKILHVDRLLQRHVLHLEIVQEGGHGPMDLRQG